MYSESIANYQKGSSVDVEQHNID